MSSCTKTAVGRDLATTGSTQRCARLEERARLSSEIDDTLAASLAALCVHLEAVRSVLATHDIYRGLDLLDQARRIAEEGLRDSRRAAEALRSRAYGLDGHVRALVSTHRSTDRAAISLRVHGRPEPVGTAVTVALLRTADEALSNAAKHAPAQPVLVRLRYATREVTLAVANKVPPPGRGAPLNAVAVNELSSGYGLTSVRERLLLVGGSLTVSLDEARRTVFAQVPR